MNTQNEMIQELNEELKESLQSTIRLLQGILDDVISGNYGSEQARMDYENMMFNDGIDFMSIIGDIANTY